MSSIQQGYFVTMHYDMVMEDGSEIGTTRDSEPLSFILGMMETDPPALGASLLGKPLDYEGTVVLGPTEAYGEALPIEQSVGVVPVSSFPENFPMDPGMIFEVEVEGRGYVPGMILEVVGDDVRLKYGHPLAGHTITFNITVVEARLATNDDVEMLRERYAPGAQAPS